MDNTLVEFPCTLPAGFIVRVSTAVVPDTPGLPEDNLSITCHLAEVEAAGWSGFCLQGEGYSKQETLLAALYSLREAQAGKPEGDDDYTEISQSLLSKTPASWFGVSPVRWFTEQDKEFVQSVFPTAQCTLGAPQLGAVVCSPPGGLKYPAKYLFCNSNTSSESSKAPNGEEASAQLVVGWVVLILGVIVWVINLAKINKSKDKDTEALISRAEKEDYPGFYTDGL